ncbi:type II toxin-antitoxin system VapC family toxin [Dyadobacter sp. CY326]|uniref:type II toxin-antitoxin system tRNA(fMet)-specific endonuclease VapC n=1 Tax=Dyadobacter sp. CY326 TaxID=2907300 RepID=UPI001F3EC0FC|nr:type II toxin-antitoxin system VapC family toxin [Dyadobacter sp. CY326]MCE7067885.1 type II toxin-antitoxin system VapC family toxin [Dyadobacter sp. CY326]
MKYLLDTNIVAYIIKKRPVEVFNKLLSVQWEEVGISSIVLAELWFGVAKSQHKEQNRMALEHFLAPFTIIDFDTKAAETYALIRADLEAKGNIIGANDLLIAAHALSHELILVTNNMKEFERVENLKIENWVLE